MCRCALCKKSFAQGDRIRIKWKSKEITNSVTIHLKFPKKIDNNERQKWIVWTIDEFWWTKAKSPKELTNGHEKRFEFFKQLKNFPDEEPSR